MNAYRVCTFLWDGPLTLLWRTPLDRLISGDVEVADRVAGIPQTAPKFGAGPGDVPFRNAKGQFTNDRNQWVQQGTLFRQLMESLSPMPCTAWRSVTNLDTRPMAV